MKKYLNFIKESRIYRDCPVLNPFFFDGKKIEDIVVFDSNGSIFNLGCGWFGGGNNNLAEVYFPNILSKRKIDFNSKDTFIAKQNNKIALFIPANIVDYKYVGEYNEPARDSITKWKQHQYTIQVKLNKEDLDYIPRTYTENTYIGQEKTEYGITISKLCKKFEDEYGPERWQTILEQVEKMIKKDSQISEYFLKIIQDQTSSKFGL